MTDDRPPVDLSRSRGFSIGQIEVRPAHRELRTARAVMTIEPRIMRLLVALAERRGEIVGHDELIARCWDGVVVGDSAIRRAVSRLRELSRAIGDESFSIETIPKVGYRLVETGSAAAGEPAPVAPARPATGRPGPRVHARRIAAALTLLGMLAAAFWWLRPSAPGPVRVAIVAQPGAESGQMARDVRATLAGLADARPDHVLAILTPDMGPADYHAGIQVSADGTRLRASATLGAEGGGPLLWAARFDRPADEAIDLRQEVAAALHAVLPCLATARSEGAPLDVATLRGFLSACARLKERPDMETLRLLRAVAGRRPDFAPAIAELAFAEAQLSRLGTDAAPAQRDSLRRSAAARLAALGGGRPELGAVHLARYAIIDRRQWLGQLRALERGLRAAPGDARLHHEHAQVMGFLGRTSDAVASARRAVQLDPLSPHHRNSLISQLAYAGYAGVAGEELEAARRIWPRSESLREVAFRFHLRFGDPLVALRMIERGEVASVLVTDANAGAAADLARARLERGAAAIDRAVAGGAAQAARDPGRAFWHLQTLGMFGRVDEAYRLLLDPRAADGLRDGPEVLFRPDLRSVRQDPRFMIVMLRIGLVRAWRQSGRWPDFCTDSGLRYDCRAETARLLAAARRSRAPRVAAGGLRGHKFRRTRRAGA